MSNEPLITVREFGTPHEAAVAKSLLSNYDIPSFVQSGETATTLFYVGTALGGAKLQVPESLGEKARKILDNEFEAAGDVPAWQCPKCNNENDAGFEVCWYCGGIYGVANEEHGKLEQPPAELPSASSSAKSMGDSAFAGDTVTESSDELADRAYRTAVLGIVLCPLQFYAAILILSAWKETLSKTSRRKLITASVITASVFLAYLSVFGKLAANSIFSQPVPATPNELFRSLPEGERIPAEPEPNKTPLRSRQEIHLSIPRRDAKTLAAASAGRSILAMNQQARSWSHS